jgi:hypothetical protein
MNCTIDIKDRTVTTAAQGTMGAYSVLRVVLKAASFNIIGILKFLLVSVLDFGAHIYMHFYNFAKKYGGVVKNAGK